MSSTPCYLLTRCGGFIGCASAADLYFCLFVNIKYGFWADLVYGIGFAAQFGGRMHVSKADLLDFEISCFLQILLMVSDSLVLYFDTYFRSLLCFEATQKTCIEKPPNLVVEFRLDLPWGPDW